MSEQDGPARWRVKGDVPPELKRALRALGQQDQSPARLDRVATRLGPLVDASLPANPGAGALLRQARSKLLATRLALAALAVGVTAIWYAQTRPSLSEGTPSPAVERAALEPASDRAEAPTPAALPAQADERSPTMRTTSTPVVPQSSSAPVKLRSEFANRPRLSASEAARKEVVAPAVVDEPVSAVIAHAQATVIKPSLTLAPPQSEVDLLFEARATKKRDPRAALVLLDEHRARFPDGLLAPEREVLAIQTLRELGQTSVAQQRLRAFRARYPVSLHLPRLERSR